MVALLDPRVGLRGADDVPPAARRPVLRLVGGREDFLHEPPTGGVDGPRRGDPGTVIGPVVVAIAIVAALVGVRVVQGGPPASTWDGLAGGSPVPVVASAGPGDRVVVVRPGDTLWDLAAAVAPGVDRWAAVDRLAEANGGATIVPGQRLVIPADLVPDLP